MTTFQADHLTSNGDATLQKFLGLTNQWDRANTSADAAPLQLIEEGVSTSARSKEQRPASCPTGLLLTATRADKGAPGLSEAKSRPPDRARQEFAECWNEKARLPLPVAGYFILT
ncbi:hypothetical protein ACIP1T_03815 [Pseudomonas japonica]|uniref:hypothetical protein n=1 Tax=Pseudomonas japonica TaxID=256466 RepID=UPI003808B6F2